MVTRNYNNQVKGRHEAFIKLLRYHKFTIHAVSNQTLNYFTENYYKDMLMFSSQVYIFHILTSGAISFSADVGWNVVFYETWKVFLHFFKTAYLIVES